MQGITEYLPVVFDLQYFCQFHASIHSTLSDFWFRIRPLKSLFELDDEDESFSNQNYKSEADFFFSDSEGNVPSELNVRDVDDVHEAYLWVLIKTYEKQKQKFENIRDSCMKDED